MIDTTEKKVNDVLVHFGIAGMKWGKHKAQEKEFRNKLTNILKDKKLDGSDREIFKERNQTVVKRLIKSVASHTAQVLVGDIIKSVIQKKDPKYLYTNKKDIFKRVAHIATRTASDMALNEVLARSAAKRYNQDGSSIVKTKLLTREDGIKIGVKMAKHFIKAAPLIKMTLNMKMSQIRRTRNNTEETFNKWGANILPSKINDVIFVDNYKVR